MIGHEWSSNFFKIIKGQKHLSFWVHDIFTQMKRNLNDDTMRGNCFSFILYHFFHGSSYCQVLGLVGSSNLLSVVPLKCGEEGASEEKCFTMFFLVNFLTQREGRAWCKW